MELEKRSISVSQAYFKSSSCIEYDMERTTQHITYDPFDDTTEIKCLINSIVSKNTTIISVITTIKLDMLSMGKLDHFETTW